MKISLGKLLKHLSLIAMMLSISPIVLIVAYIFKIEPSLHELVYTSIFVVVMGYLGYLHNFLDSRLTICEKCSVMLKKLLRGVIYVLTFIVPIYILFAVRQLNLVLGFTNLVLGIISYILMSSKYERSYEEILRVETFVLVLSVYIPSYVITDYRGFVIGFIAIVLLYFMVQNQSELESMLERTQKNTPMIGQVRRTNIKWMIVLSLCIIIVYPLRHLLVSGMEFVGKGIIYALTWFIKTFMQSEESRIIKDDLPTGDQGFMLPEGGSNWLGNLLTVLFIISVIVLCIVKRREIWYGIQTALISISKYLSKLLNKLFGERSYKKFNEVYYSEVVEEMTQEHIIMPKAKKNVNRWALKKQFKAFTKEENKEKKYRMGYKLLLDIQCLKGIKKKISHTPREIVNLIKDDKEIKNIYSITEAYERVRYGEKLVENEEVKSLEETLKDLI